jgi:hypothetical protein
LETNDPIENCAHSYVRVLKKEKRKKLLKTGKKLILRLLPASFSDIYSHECFQRRYEQVGEKGGNKKYYVGAKSG